LQRKKRQPADPFSEHAAYVNVRRDATGKGQKRVREADGPTCNRPPAVKNKYAPTNFSRPNANIMPTV
jgi:hypothetical protein